MTEDLEPLVQIPDGIEPIVAYRAWRCEVRDGRPVLRSVSPISRRSEWTAGGWTRAECLARGARSRRRRDPTHEVPAEGCTCGIYALRELSPVFLPGDPIGFRSDSTPPILVGRVQLAGKVIEHEEGYRAERARLLEVLPAPGQEPFAERVAGTYGAGVSDELTTSIPRLEADRRAMLARGWAGARPRGAGWGVIGGGPLLIQILLILIARASGLLLLDQSLRDHSVVGVAVVVTLIALWVIRMAFIPANLRRLWPTGWFRRRSDPKQSP